MGGLVKRYENVWELRYIMRLEGIDKNSSGHFGGSGRRLYLVSPGLLHGKALWHLSKNEDAAIGKIAAQACRFGRPYVLLLVREGIIARTFTSTECLKVF